MIQPNRKWGGGFTIREQLHKHKYVYGSKKTQTFNICNLFNEKKSYNIAIMYNKYNNTSFTKTKYLTNSYGYHQYLYIARNDTQNFFLKIRQEVGRY